MATPSCSHWWHCPIYLAMAITLTAIAISSVNYSSSPILSLSSNASLALQTHNFSSIDTLLQTNPQLFLSSPQFTFFAIQDDPFSKINSHPRFLKQLLEYHSVPFKLPFKELKNKPHGTCFKTLAENKQIRITKNENGILEINHVAVSHPDLFLGEHVVIHGVNGPFAKFDSGKMTEIPFHENGTGIEGLGQWRNVIRFLSSKGYVSFGVGLNSVLDGVIQENPNLVLATVFAAVDFGFVSSSWGILGKIVMCHIVPGRFIYEDLASLPNKSVLKTLDLNQNLVISVKNVETEQKLRINGVEIVAPNAYLSKQFVIHGISRAFKLEGLPNTSL